MLKLDLLPAHYTIARRNKKVIFLSIPLLVGVALLWLLVMVQMNSTIGRTQADLETTKAEADKVRQLQADTDARKAELKPIQDKVDFVLAADKSGGQYWERFHAINKYIYDRAHVTRFSLTPPNSVAFDVEIETTEEAGRFILNLIRCPDITGISISGQPVSGGTIEGLGGVAAAAATAGGGQMGPGMPGAPGGPGMPGGPEMGGPGGPGAPPGGMPGGPGAGPGAAPAGGQAGPIRFSVTARLVKPLSLPQPPSGAAAGGGGGPGGPGGGAGGPGGPPGAGPGGPPGGAGGGPGGPPGGGGGEPAADSPKAGKGGGGGDE